MQYLGHSHAEKNILTADLKIKVSWVFCIFTCLSGHLPESLDTGEQAGLAGHSQKSLAEALGWQPLLPHTPGSVPRGWLWGSGLIEMSSYYQQRCLCQEGTSKTP